MGTSKKPKHTNKEQEAILSLKKELELVYKDFIKCVFCTTSDSSFAVIKIDDEMKRLASSVDLRLNTIIERFSDFYDDSFTSGRGNFLVARLRGLTAPNVQDLAGGEWMAAKAQESVGAGLFVDRGRQLKMTFMDSGKKQGRAGIAASGPIKAHVKTAN